MQTDCRKNSSSSTDCRLQYLEKLKYFFNTQWQKGTKKRLKTQSQAVTCTICILVGDQYNICSLGVDHLIFEGGGGGLQDF